jgi:undecaprenyl-diphosphatase
MRACRKATSFRPGADALLDTLYQLDVAVFRWVNQGWSCPFLDRFFSFITNINHFSPLILVLFVYWLWKGGAKGRWLVLSLIVAVILSDQISSHIIKPLVERARPCNALDGVLAPAGKSSAYSFTSTHAANVGSTMLLLSLTFRPWTRLFVLIAFLIGLSRVYLGLHYPTDVLGGYALGALLGYSVWLVVEKCRVLMQNKPASNKTASWKGSKKSARTKTRKKRS